MERFRVALYAPDRAIVYDGRTPDATGVGGGITARLCMVEALAALGHDVTAYVNCAASIEHAGVRYVPVTSATRIDADVLVAISTGGALTFAPLRHVEVNARLRIVWVQGVPQPADIEAVSPDYIYVASNFLRDVCVDRWGMPAGNVFVCYNGLKQDVFAGIEAAPPARDPFALAYVGPPDKGLDAATAILGRLRAHDARFHLHVFGGPRLWGQDEGPLSADPGLVFHSMLGQRALAAELFRMEYLVAPQAMEEGFGIAVQEARRAGAIVLASAVGSFPELIAPDVDGYLVSEPHTTDAAVDRFVTIVRMLNDDNDRRARVRTRGVQAARWNWTTAAEAWVAHWESVVPEWREGPSGPSDSAVHPATSGIWLTLPDGYHSTTTGCYVPRYGAHVDDTPRPKRILIAGYYGHGNLGDEVILDALVTGLRARHPDLHIVVASGDPEDTRARLPVEAVHERDVPALIDAASRADLIVLGGGGLLHDHFGCDENTVLTPVHWGLSSCVTLAAIAEAVARPLVLCGVGVGPLTTDDGRRLTRLIVERADRVVVRDQASADLLRALGVERPDIVATADLAWLCRHAGPDPPPTPRPTLVVAIRHWDRGSPWEPALAAALDLVVERHQAAVTFVPLQAGREGDLTDDGSAARRVQAAMRHQQATTVVGVPGSSADALSLFASATVVVAMRLHAAILAATAGTPVVALAYDAKVRHAMEQLGSGDDSLDPATIDAQVLADRIASVIEHRDAVAARLRSQVIALRAAAARNLSLTLSTLATEPRAPSAPSPEWTAFVARSLVRQARRAAAHEAGVAFLKDELLAKSEALTRSEHERAATARLLTDRTEDIAWISVELGTLQADVDARPAYDYARMRRALRRYRRGLSRRIVAAGTPAARAIGRVYDAVVPAPARAALARMVQRRLMSWPAYTFDRYKRTRSAVYGTSLAGVRAPGVPGLVTVVLPAYNGAAMMREAIDSVLAQTHRDLELIVVNDGSTDDTPRIADTYARVDPRVRVIHQDNQTLPRALSKGFRAARGEFLTWTSCDNRMAPTFLARMVDCLTRHPDWDMAYANLDIIGDDGRPLRNTTFYGPDQHPPGSEHIHLPETTEALNVVANNSIGAAFLYRSRVATLIGDYSPHRFVLEDYDYWMRVNAAMTLRHADFDDTLYEYRFHGTSLTSRWEEFDMLGHRDRLMVFEDFRRDFLLGRLVWIVEGEGAPITRDLRARLQQAGHLLIDDTYALTALPRCSVPLVYVRITDDPRRTSVGRSDLPAWALRVCVTTARDLPDTMPDEFGLCCAMGPSPAPPHLRRPHQGWLQVTDVEALFHALDIRAKSDQLARIEALAEAGDPPSVRATVVICTRAAGDALANAVASIARQSMPADTWELVVVDNHPAAGEVRAQLDGLRAGLFPSRPGQMRVVACPIAGLSAARNAGTAEAHGEVVAFLDDDAVAEVGWLQAVCEAFADRPHIGVVGGHIRLRVPEPRPEALQPGWEKYWSHFVTEHPGFTEVSDWRQFPWGANWSARRAALRAAGGFRTQYGRTGHNYWGGEELVAARLIQRLGYTIAIEPAAVVDHLVAPDRFTREHIRRTLPAGYHVGHLALRDGYLPAASSAIGAALVPLLTSHVDRTVPEGRYRRLDAWYRKRAQFGVLRRVIGDLFRRARRPVVS